MTITSIIDKNEWNSVLKEQFSSCDSTCYRYEYFDLYQKHFHTKPETLFWEDENLKIFWPHLVRDINRIEYFKHVEYFDLTVPYCFYGPIVVLKKESETYPESITKFITLYQEYAKKNRYVSEFIRFHPFLENWKFFLQSFDIVHVNDMVMVDLSKDIPTIWKGINATSRWEIGKAEKEFEQIVYTEQPSHEEMETFCSLYTQSMEKNKAEKKYLFSNEFLQDHFHHINPLLVYCKNPVTQVVGASTLFLKDAQVLHVYLSGNNYGYKYSPFRLVLWEACKWAKLHRFTYLHLGGWKAKNDTIFQFKLSISKTTNPLYIGKLIFNTTIYNELVSQNPLLKGKEDYFPLYRKNLDNSVV